VYSEAKVFVGPLGHLPPEKMATLSPNDPNWRSMNHQFDSIPPNVQGYIREQLRVPPAHAATFLPPQNMSVIDFIYSYSLPPVCKDPAKYSIPDRHSFFSRELPDDNVGILARLTVPPRTVIALLVKDGKQEWLNGNSSISLPGEPMHFPMWAAQFWSELSLTIEPVFSQWRRALEWLRRKEFHPFHDEIRATVYSLSTLSWSGRLTPLLPGKTAFLKSSLQVFLSRNWLSDSHIDQLTYLLERDLQEQKKSFDVHLIDSILARKILSLYDAEKNNNQIYLPEGDEFFWQRFGARLGPKSRIGAVFHINGNHWVSTVVDVAMEELAYGDPMNSDQDTRIKAALLWFISKHVTSLDPATVQHDECLPCPSQSVTSDWFNCGIFSHNALSHYFCHEPLLRYTHDPVFGDLERLRILRKLITTHNAMVSGVHPALKSMSHRDDLESTRAAYTSLVL